MDTKTLIESKKKSKCKKPKKDSTDDEGVSDLVIAEDCTTPKSNKSGQTIKQQTVNNSNSKKRKKRDSASSDEERWLTAIESGKLEDVDDELKKIKPKDPALMTARQRAMYDRGSDGSPSAAPTLMSLPTGYKEKVMTAEAIQKAAIKSQKRKQLADEKREKDKKKTMERLLKKQESKALKTKTKYSKNSTEPVITYIQNIDHTILQYPPDVEFPLKKAKLKDPPKPKYCEMGCGNIRKYSCSISGVSLCSIECYRKNISRTIL